MSDEAKTCLHCPKTLRSDNTRGICTDCAKTEKKDVNGETTHERQWRMKKEARSGEVKEPPASPRMNPPPKSKADAEETLAKFHIVAEAIGKDPDELLAQLAGEWLSKLRDEFTEG